MDCCNPLKPLFHSRLHFTFVPFSRDENYSSHFCVNFPRFEINGRLHAPFDLHKVNSDRRQVEWRRLCMDKWRITRETNYTRMRNAIKKKWVMRQFVFILHHANCTSANTGLAYVLFSCLVICYSCNCMHYMYRTYSSQRGTFIVLIFNSELGEIRDHDDSLYS